MSNHDPIEDALQRLRPSDLDSPLMARLTAARPLSDAPAQKSTLRDLLLRWLLPLGTSAGVAVATFAILEQHRNHSAGGNEAKVVESGEAPLPVESQDFLVSARPVGIVVAPDQKPYRIMDVEWLEYQTIRAEAGGPALHTATTRRDVIPVALETY